MSDILCMHKTLNHDTKNWVRIDLLRHLIMYIRLAKQKVNFAIWQNSKKNESVRFGRTGPVPRVSGPVRFDQNDRLTGDSGEIRQI